MSSEQGKGKLYRLNCDGSLQVMVENVGCSNAMAFRLDRSGLFYTDSFAGDSLCLITISSMAHFTIDAFLPLRESGWNARWRCGRQGRPGMVCLLGGRLQSPAFAPMAARSKEFRFPRARFPA
jgi:hypothetical protein